MEEMIKTNKEIEEEIRIEKKKMKNRIKILLLGCGEAGKVILTLQSTGLPTKKVTLKTT